MGIWPAISRELNKISTNYRFIDWTRWTEMGMKQQARDTLVQESDRFDPDLTVLHVQYDGLMDGETAGKLRGKVVNYTLDVIDPLPRWFYDVGREIDMTVFPDDEDTDALRRDGIDACTMLPGYDETVFNPDGPAGDFGDVVFLGNSYPKETHNYQLTDYRWEFAGRMKREFPKEFKMYGFGWNDEEHKLGSGIADGVLMYRLGKEAECYRGCKIAINLSHFERSGYTSDRMFRIMGSGAFCLAKWYPGIERDFKDGEHLRTWRDLDELEGLVRYYLSHDEERVEMAKAGQRHVSTTATWGHRVSQLVKRIQP